MSIIGKQIAHLRDRRRMTQKELAEASGVGIDLIRKLEQGQRSPARIDSITDLAHALDVSPADLLGKPRGLVVGAEDGEVGGIRRAVLGMGELPEPPAPADLRTATAELWTLYWGGRYAELARELPVRIGQARAAVYGASTADQPVAQARLAGLLQLTASLLAHLAHEDLSHLALAEATRLADESGDELLHAAQQATRSWVLSRQGLWSDAERVAVDAAARVEPALSQSSLDQVAVWGELLRYGTTAVARSGRQAEAKELLGLVGAAASRMGTDQQTRYIGVAFGPTVAAMKAVDVAIAADRPRTAIALAERVEHPQVVPTAMHARYLLNVAWAQMMDWRSQDAVDTVRAAERLAPEILAHQTIAHVIVDELMPRRSKQRLPGLVALARRMEAARAR